MFGVGSLMVSIKVVFTEPPELLANTVYSVIGDVSVGTPEMIPDSPDRDMVPLNSNPAGRAGKIDHVPGSIPDKSGTMMKPDWLSTASKTSPAVPLFE